MCLDNTSYLFTFVSLNEKYYKNLSLEDSYMLTRIMFQKFWDDMGEDPQLKLQECLYTQQLHSYVPSHYVSSLMLFLSTTFSPFSFCLHKSHPVQRACL